MGWALRASAQRHVINMSWGHRCAGLELALLGEGRPRQSVVIVGLHAPYEAGGIDIGAASLVQIVRERKRPGRLLVAGGWNVDPLPCAARDADVEARWRLWDAVLEAMGLVARCASSVAGRPPGPLASAAVATAATWCALREVGQVLVSRALDWVAVSPLVADTPFAKWDMRWADHACLYMKLPLFFARRRRPPSKWRTADLETSYVAWQRLALASPPLDAQGLHTYVAGVVAASQCAATARERSHARLPMQARDCFAKAAAQDSAREARRLRDIGRAITCEHRRSQEGARLRERIRRGSEGAGHFCSACRLTLARSACRLTLARSQLRFFHRRARSAAVECRAAGLWSSRAARLVVQWADHVQRERRPPSHRPAQLAGWHGAHWRAERRRIAGSPALAAGRMDARPSRGYVALRWHDAVATARTLF